MKRAQGDGKPLSLLMIDVDKFKMYNDCFGHHAGDFVLFALARLLKTQLRPTDVGVRYGGDEFVAVLPDTRGDQAFQIAERIRTSITRVPLVLPDTTPVPSVSVSVGVGEMRSEQSPAEFVQTADAAMYRAKKAGSNRTSY
jgi:diguanylate cyclase (GGDEF)-like protein